MLFGIVIVIAGILVFGLTGVVITDELELVLPLITGIVITGGFELVLPGIVITGRLEFVFPGIVIIGKFDPLVILSKAPDKDGVVIFKEGIGLCWEFIYLLILSRTY